MEMEESLPLLGIRLSRVKIFLNERISRTWKTEDVCEKFIKPFTESCQLSVCDMLAKANDDDVGRAEVFISHAWAYNFNDLIETLLDHFQEKEDPFLWIDIFTVNQHNKPKSEWWMTSFQKAIEIIGRCILVLDTFLSPLPLSRVWCVFEMFACVVSNSSFEIILFPGEEENLKFQLERLMNLPNARDHITRLFHIDLRLCYCKEPKDKEMIFSEIRKLEGGIGRVNGIVCGYLSDWAIKTIERQGENSLPLASAKNYLLQGTTPALQEYGFTDISLPPGAIPLLFDQSPYEEVRRLYLQGGSLAVLNPASFPEIRSLYPLGLPPLYRSQKSEENSMNEEKGDVVEEEDSEEMLS